MLESEQLGGSRATAVTSDRHATLLDSQRVSEPSADFARIGNGSMWEPAVRNGAGSARPGWTLNREPWAAVRVKDGPPARFMP